MGSWQRIAGFWLYHSLIIYLGVWWPKYKFNELEQDIKTSLHSIYSQTTSFVTSRYEGGIFRKLSDEEFDRIVDDLDRRFWLSKMIADYLGISIKRKHKERPNNANNVVVNSNLTSNYDSLSCEEKSG